MFKKTYFSLSDNLNPLVVVDKWLNPGQDNGSVLVHGYPLTVTMTSRAKRALNKRAAHLIVEMQLYFSCVVKKRVIFHDEYDGEKVKVNEKLYVAFRAVEPTSCDPLEFAQSYPEKSELRSEGARRMHATRLDIDYRRSQWLGTFSV